jgi:hypothetical protein
MSDDYADRARDCIDRAYPFEQLPTDRDELLRLAGLYAALAQAQQVERQTEQLSELLDTLCAGQAEVVDRLDDVVRELTPEPGWVGRMLSRWQARRFDARNAEWRAGLAADAQGGTQ